MKCVVCTLFEREYHLGVAVLINSLCDAGFQGVIYAGFRGPLPPWAEEQVDFLPDGNWGMQVSPAVRVIFVSLKTEAHFTNYKPDFLLQVEALAASASDAVIYADPDIVLNVEWQYIEDWLSCGVILCDDVNAPLSENHPRRMGWRRFFKPLGFDLKFRAESYANGGFIGLAWKDRKLLLLWQEFTGHIAAHLGGKNVIGIAGDSGQRLEGFYGFADCFRQPDQDALNAVLEACPEMEVSFLGRSAMGFQVGQAILPHSLGPAKPWKRRYVREALSGLPPVTVDKAFWNHVDGPIRPFAPMKVYLRRLQITIGAALGRFIKRR